MKAAKIDGVEVCKEWENLETLLGLNVIERVVYSHLLRRACLEEKRRQHFSLHALASNLRISRGPVRDALHLLARHGALRFIERSYNGYLVEVRLPAEVPAVRRKAAGGRTLASLCASPTRPLAELDLEQLDFLRSRKLGRAIHAREGRKCFYCLRRIPRRSHCLDHVVPRAKSGQNSYRNLVSCCPQCNWHKRDHSAEDFLRELYRQGRLSHEDLSGRLAKLQALADGKLKPVVSNGAGAGGESNEAKK